MNRVLWILVAVTGAFANKLASGALSPEQAAVAPQLIFNQRLDAALAMLLVAILWVVIADAARVCIRVVLQLPVPLSSEAPAIRALVSTWDESTKLDRL
jgi:carbon starvation protein